ncbi:MAG TPA: hypothetical protein VK184_23415 [Nostocaceae cyanobacterium]|nr:hypothetical protein [Nostocaceae cyanobacterium]
MKRLLYSDGETPAIGDRHFYLKMGKVVNKLYDQGLFRYKYL